MKILTTLTLLTICLTATAQPFPIKKEGWFRIDSLFTKDGKRHGTPMTNHSYKGIDTEFKYSDATGNAIILQNSFPRSAGNVDEKNRYTDANGKAYGYAIFWTRVVNETATPFELIINFPATTPSPYSPIKLFLPAYAMTPEKESMLNYGITGLKSFSDTDFNKTTLNRTIQPKEEYLFYTLLLSPLHYSGGSLRTGYALNQKDLFYNLAIRPEFDSALFSCGQIVFKK